MAPPAPHAQDATRAELEARVVKLLAEFGLLCIDNMCAGTDGSQNGGAGGT
eukprot:CAMPEP_0172913478 /NCGR_PEP_ID=MMETSP1075-20121228/190434_1 /TAXON_ID=2916 /ORGANISM="Ceratium fusus, Strain PA161109" /LENGTH=50 /DNA_ID=CAMNT_0013772191 /DNA_START=36 /DNA_END=185 /DNA_ORIENTATION=+